jgi:predicted TIM-barrel fold metal-dependent hydrolase
MFASNFPVDGLCADFRTIFSGFDEITTDLTAEERQRLFHGNAERIYRLHA